MQATQVSFFHCIAQLQNPLLKLVPCLLLCTDLLCFSLEHVVIWIKLLPVSGSSDDKA